MSIKFSVKMDFTIPTIQLKYGIAMIVNASLITQLMTLMFVRRRVANVLVRKTMTAELATCVKMNITNTQIALIVIVAQITQSRIQMFAI